MIEKLENTYTAYKWARNLWFFVLGGIVLNASNTHTLWIIWWFTNLFIFGAFLAAVAIVWKHVKNGKT